MTIREQDIGAHLAATAAQVSEPQFDIRQLMRRIRQRRTRLIAMTGLSMAMIMFGTVAGLLSLEAGSHQAAPETQPLSAAWLPIKISVLGQTAQLSRSGSRPILDVPAGRQVHITAQVNVPHGVRVRTLWLGIVSADRSSVGPGGPTGWAPILLRIRTPLTAGIHTFRLHWAVPSNVRPDRKVYLISYWSTGRSAPEPVIAAVVIRRT